MTVEWREKRWPGCIHLLLRLLRVRAAEQGALYIQADEPGPLGRLFLEDAGGVVRYALIDCSRNRKKWFYLPASAAETGLVLKNETGETLFALAAAPSGGEPMPPVPSAGEKASAMEKKDSPILAHASAPDEPPSPQSLSAQADETRADEPPSIDPHDPQPQEAPGRNQAKGETES